MLACLTPQRTPLGYAGFFAASNGLDPAVLDHVGVPSPNQFSTSYTRPWQQRLQRRTPLCFGQHVASPFSFFCASANSRQGCQLLRHGSCVWLMLRSGAPDGSRSGWGRPMKRAPAPKARYICRGSGDTSPGKFLNLHSLKCHFLHFEWRVYIILNIIKRNIK